MEVSTYRPFYIIGAVNRPGQYPYVDHMNALNAIALAGGFTAPAVQSAVFIRREGSNKEEQVPVDRTTTIHPGRCAPGAKHLLLGCGDVPVAACRAPPPAAAAAAVQ